MMDKRGREQGGVVIDVGGTVAGVRMCLSISRRLKGSKIAGIPVAPLQQSKAERARSKDSKYLRTHNCAAAEASWNVPTHLIDWDAN
jgi:hypothetical protein